MDRRWRNGDPIVIVDPRDISSECPRRDSKGWGRAAIEGLDA